MSNTNRDDGGKYTATVSDEEILAAIDQASAPVVTTADLEETLPIGRRAIRERLLDLREQGRVNRKKVGGRAVVWWHVSREDADGSAKEGFEDDPLFDLPIFSSGASDISANVDEHIAEAIAGESKTEK